MSCESPKQVARETGKTPMGPTRAVVAASFLALIAACSGPGQCPLQPVIVLTDSKTGQAICDATVVATTSAAVASEDGGAVGSFTVVAGGPAGCEYRAKFGASAPYSIQVSAPGYAPYSLPGVQPISIPCNQVASPGTIEIALHPSG